MKVEFKEKVRQTAHSTYKSTRDLTRGRLLARNTFFNLVGQGVPLLVAIFAIPILIKALGTDRFGFLTLVWMVIGYFSLFDFGLGRALTQLVAEKLGEGNESETAPVVWTALLIMLFLGLVGLVIVSLLCPYLVTKTFKIPQTLHVESLKSSYLLAFSIPIVISTAALRGVLAAKQRFDLINIIRISMGIFTFLGPLLVLFFSKSLVLVVAILVIGRFVSCMVYFFLCLHIMPVLRQHFDLQKTVIGNLLRLGSWMTVTNIIGPLMVYIDRFLIGSFMSMTAVAYYATPYEVVTKLLLIPSAVVSVLFPAFATSFPQEPDRTAMLFRRGIKYVFLALFPLILVIITFAQEGLYLWLGLEFSQNSTIVLKWLAVGILTNGMAQIPFGLIQGIGRPDLTAKLHLVELPFYLITLWWLLSLYGIKGAAFAWVARSAIDALMLCALANRLLKGKQSIVYLLGLTAGTTLVILTFAFLPLSPSMKGFCLLLTLAVFPLVIWCLILNQEEQKFVLNFLKISQILNMPFINNIKR